MRYFRLPKMCLLMSFTNRPKKRLVVINGLKQVAASICGVTQKNRGVILHQDQL